MNSSKLKFLVFMAMCLAVISLCGWMGSGLDGFIDAPTQISPGADDIVLTGKDSLEFRWRGAQGARSGHYEFKLYKSYQTTAENLILKEDYQSGIYSAKIPSSQFEKNQVYTWSLREILIDGQRSDYAYSSFKVIEK